MGTAAGSAPDVPRAEEPDGAPRIVGLDVLRGVAILAILFMNINDMGGSLWVLFAGDIRHLGWTPADRVAWFLREVLANGTARCLLEMLFGAGMVILTARVAAGDGRWSALKRYYWRNLVLFAFGLVHMFVLLWPGDILHTYGLAAMLAFLFRRLRARWLLIVGLSMAGVQFVGGGYGYIDVRQRQEAVAAVDARRAAGQPLTREDAGVLKVAADRQAGRDQRAAKSTARIRAEDAARSGSFATWARSAWDTIGAMVGKGLELVFVWEAASTMLIGAALFKLGILQGQRTQRFYLAMMAIGYGFGLSARAVGAFDEMRFDDAASIIWPLDELARLATTLGHVGLLYLLMNTTRGPGLLRPFAAAGRTALSLYVMQTLICLWVLYPPQGFALYGQQGWATLMLTALAIDAVLLWLANRYIGRFRIAPVEWAWRSIVERRPLPFRRTAIIGRPAV